MPLGVETKVTRDAAPCPERRYERGEVLSEAAVEKRTRLVGKRRRRLRRNGSRSTDLRRARERCGTLPAETWLANVRRSAFKSSSQPPSAPYCGSHINTEACTTSMTGPLNDTSRLPTFGPPTRTCQALNFCHPELLRPAAAQTLRLNENLYFSSFNSSRPCIHSAVQKIERCRGCYVLEARTYAIQGGRGLD